MYVAIISIYKHEPDSNNGNTDIRTICVSDKKQICAETIRQNIHNTVEDCKRHEDMRLLSINGINFENDEYNPESQSIPYEQYIELYIDRNIDTEASIKLQDTSGEKYMYDITYKTLQISAN